MTTEDKLKDLVLERYGTVSAFTQSIGMANSTFATILKIGIHKSSIANIIKICQALKISTDELANGNIVPVEEHEKEDFDILDFVKIFRYKLTDPESAVLDGQHLTADEIGFFLDSMDLVIEQMRRKREK